MWKYKYKTALTSYISWVRVRRDNVRWTNGANGHIQNKWELKFLYRKKIHLIKELRKMLCNALMRVQPGTLISLKKWKRKTKFCAVTFYMMHQGIFSGELYLNYLFHKGALYTRHVNWVLDAEFSKLWFAFCRPQFLSLKLSSPNIYVSGKTLCYGVPNY